jgi:pimeloyl-ACP methyl ester carboxylesterase
MAFWLATLVLLTQLDGSGSEANPIRVAIDERGTIDAAQLVTTLSDQIGLTLPRPPQPSRLPIRGVAGALITRTITETLGPAVSVSLEPDALVIRLLPKNPADGTLEDLRQRVRSLSAQLDRLSRREQRYGMRALSSYRPNDPARPAVLLVHGMNSSSGSFVHMIPLLERAGFGVVVYDYAFNRDLDELAPAFARDWKAFRERVGERRAWAVVTHSMGALLARWYVEGQSYGGDVSALVLVAPPNGGSAAARAQTILQLIQGTEAVNGRQASALAQLGDGLGEAASDMLPGSAFLTRLQGCSRRPGVRYYVIAGDRGFLDEPARRRLEGRLGLVMRNGGILGSLTRLASHDVTRQLDELSDGTGDGCVSVASTRLDGATEHVVLHANHVELIRGPLLYPDPGPVICMPYVLRWLGAAAE